MSTAGEYEYKVFNVPPQDAEVEPDELLILGEHYEWRTFQSESVFSRAVRVEVIWIGLDGDHDEPVALYTRKTVNNKWKEELF